MNKKYISALVCGFAAAVLSIIPGLESIACCLFVPVASGFAVALYKKSSSEINRINTGTGVLIGLLTGIVAALLAVLFEMILTYITKTNDLIVAMPDSEKMIKDMNLGPTAEEALNLLRRMVNEIQTTGFSFFYLIIITIMNLITYTIFGILGGVVGTVIINKRNAAQN
jgi:hypothetical protein